MWLEILKNVAAKSSKAFRFLTCGTVDLINFRLINMEEDSDEDKEQDYELRVNIPHESDLQGFKSKIVDH